LGFGALVLEPLLARLRRRSAQIDPTAGFAASTERSTGLLLANSTSASGVVAREARGVKLINLAPLITGIGLLATLVLAPLTQNVPTARSLAASLAQLLVVGIVLGAWSAWRERRYGALQLWLVAAAVLPLFTIIVDGFLGFGAVALLSVVSVVASFSRLRVRWILAVLLVSYLGLSFYVTYMRDREAIRAVVWNDAGLDHRVDQVSAIFTDFELFNPQRHTHLIAIDDRLNQNLLVGLAVSYLDAGLIEYAQGGTVIEAFAAVVPRVLWPNKPYTAGGSALVTRFTGVEFAQGTSVGIGQVLELYANFGFVGVSVGFLLLGTVVGVFDRQAATHLRRGHQLGFVFWYLPGLTLMIPGNSLADMFSSFCAALFTALIVTRVLVPLLTPIAAEAH